MKMCGLSWRKGLASVLCGVTLWCSAAEDAPLTDGEVWNEGVTYYEAGDVTNALRVLRPLMLSKSHGPRAAEVVAKLEYDRGNLVEAAAAAQLALRAAPDDARAQRNFTRAVDGLPQQLEARHVESVLKAAQGQDPGSLLQAATANARALMTESGNYRTNAPARAVALADALSARATRLADAWLPVREAIAQSVTNEEQAATILEQLNQAQAKTTKAAKELSDLDAGAYSTLADVESDFTRFLKMAILPPAAMQEDLIAQSNAWMDVAAFNSRPWQKEALDYTRSFRAKFPAWARAYEEQAKADTNKPPFTAEAQAKISAHATELEKIQLECAEHEVPAQQEKALALIREIAELLPKDNSGKGGQNGNPNAQLNQQNQNQDQNKDDQKQDPNKDDKGQSNENQTQQNDPQADEQKDQQQNEAQESQDPNDKKDDEVEALLKAAQERNDEHEADKKARMRKMKLPPNERDW